MKRSLPIALATALLVLFAPASPAAAAAGIAPAREFAPHRVIVRFEGERWGHARRLGPGVGVREATSALRRDPAVDYAAPDFIARASGIPDPQVPNDPGTLTGLPGVPGGWVSKQWNFLPWEG